MSSGREPARSASDPPHFRRGTHISDITDLDLARTRMERFGLSLRPLGRARPFHLVAREVSAGPLAIVHSRYHSGIEISGSVEQVQDLCIGTVISGGVELSDPRGTIDLSPGHSLVWDEAQDIRTRRPDAAELLMIRLDRGAFNRRVFDVLGPVDPAAGFTLTSPVTPADRSRWQAVLDMVEHLLTATDGRPAALLQDALDRFVVTALLDTHPNGYLASAPPLRADTVATRAAAAAADYLQAHHDQPVRMGELAMRLHLSPRALQAGFQRRYGMTMREYVRQLRVQSAHEELVDDPTVSVSDLAYRWGFSSASRFATAYRTQFGVTPALAAAQERAQRSRVAAAPKLSRSARIA